MSKKISMWSGPRNISTAMMYSFGQRSDTRVYDEPLYGAYLTRVEDVAHPGVQDVIDDMECDVDAVLADMARDTADDVRFFKNMAHHTEGLNLDLLSGLQNFILCRPPADQLVSLDEGMTATPTVRDTGYTYQTAILDWMLAHGQEPIVVVAPAVLANPEGVLRALCERLDIEWEPAMLHWPAGPKPEDGVWAAHWYASVHATTGFGAPRPERQTVPDHLWGLFEVCISHYERLTPYAIEAT
jgi:hypothetical protein